MELSVPDRSLLIFVDDTGHEALVPGHSVYGLGGCAALAADIERVIRHPVPSLLGPMTMRSP